MKRYINSKLIQEEINTKNIKGHDLKIASINGVIYRGDHHTSNVLRKTPAFYGDIKHAILYALQQNKDTYMKAYTTVKPLNLLVISKSNHVMLDTFFREVLLNDIHFNKTVVKITHVILQICVGMINGNMDALDLWDFSVKEVIDYFKYHVDEVPAELYTKIEFIIKNFNTKDIYPSRMSIRPIDKILMKNLKMLFSGYNIHGTWFDASEDPRYFTFGSKNHDDRKHLLCHHVDKYIYKNDSRQDLTCPPSELCIFNPSKYLDIPSIVKIKSKS